MNRLIFLILAIVLFFFMRWGFSSFMSYSGDLIAKDAHDELDYKNPKHLLLRQILDELMANNKFKYKDYTINVVPLAEEPIPLAQVQVGRKISFSKELLELMKTKQGKAFVLAHEIAHNELKHLNDLFSIFYGSTKLGTDKKNAFHDQRYTQSKEFDADAMAVDYIKNTYIDINEKDLLEMFDLIELVEDHYLKSGKVKMTKAEYRKYFAREASHPDHDSRRAAIKTRLKESSN
jgi:uncharacterized protein YlaN (UPF0358 family)